MSTTVRASVYAFLAAILFAASVPISKIFLDSQSPYLVAAFLYIGAGVGMLVLRGGHYVRTRTLPERIQGHELPYIVGMIVLDIAAPLLLLFGLQRATAANASLLNNFEIVATSLIALLVFKEAISRRLWIAIVLIVAATVMLSFEGEGAFQLSVGSLLVVAAAACWGLENNCTRVLSNRPSGDIVVIKGIGSGVGAILVALVVEGQFHVTSAVPAIMLLGFASYGLSITLYITAQASLGAAKTSAYYAVSPFVGVVLSFVLLREVPSWTFWPGLVLMLVATYFLITDEIGAQHTHEHSHMADIEHSHGETRHSHEVQITHSHLHAHGSDDADHVHTHEFSEADVPAHSHGV